MRYRITLALAAIATPVVAHEMWIAPSAYKIASGGPVALSLLVGDAADVKPWKFAWEKLVSLRDYAPTEMHDLQPNVTVPTTEDAAFAQLSLAGPGTHLIALESYQQPISLKAEKFNAYIKEDGLTGAIDYEWRDGVSVAGRRSRR